jgi:repressor LexA
MRALTRSQARVTAFIRQFVAKQGYPPTHAEIAAGLGFRSPNAASEHLRLLAKKGVVALAPGVSRGVRLLDKGSDRSASDESGLPLIGQVAAGQPILAEENVERRVKIDPAVFGSRADYLLRVRGDSMIEAGILSGDLVAVRRSPSVRDGEIAVVRIEDEVTVKRWRSIKDRSGTKVSLEPANAALRPLVVDPRRVTVAIEGLVVGLLRLSASGGRAR